MTLKRKLNVLRERAKIECTPNIRDSVMSIYRKRPEYITKDDLLLFGIIVKK